jgi:phosphoglycerate dehydrogenase-like enzyme
MKIVIGTGPDAATMDRWRAEFPAVEFVVAPTEAEQIAATRGADAYIGRITRDAFLDAGRQLRWVHSTGAGIESIAAIPELVESAVTVTNTRGGHAPAIADHTFALLLALTRQLPGHRDEQRHRRWKNRALIGRMRELTGATMVIVGMGNIGRAITRRAAGFDMRVFGVDAFPGEAPTGVAAIWDVDRLDEALRQADILIVAVPFTPQTAGLINARRIALLPAGAYLVAVSRGGIVDENALVDALRAGRLAGAGLDVMETEPPTDDDPLWDTPNLILTPHCSGASRLTTARVWEITAENIRRFVAGEPLQNVCDKRAGF